MQWALIIDLLKSHRNYWLLCGGLVLVNLFLYLFWVTGAHDQIERLQESYQTQRNNLKTSRKHQLEAARYAEHQKAWQQFMETVDNKIIFPERLNALEALFRRNNLDPKGLSFRSERVNGLPLVRFVSTIKISGDYDNLKALLNGIRQIPGLFCIEDLAITKDRKAGQLIVKMDLVAYFRENTPSKESTV
ncbi:MAG: hypothetical protein QNI89_14265 [Desulfobacterales bacterium]|nr:hypothetical protein [Desulfobacterales bacterium]MDJ0888470.1 hypothetical protein [Desulfobacterales bacterium]